MELGSIVRITGAVPGAGDMLTGCTAVLVGVMNGRLSHLCRVDGTVYYVDGDNLEDVE